MARPSGTGGTISDVAIWIGRWRENEGSSEEQEQQACGAAQTAADDSEGAAQLQSDEGGEADAGQSAEDDTAAQDQHVGRLDTRHAAE